MQRIFAGIGMAIYLMTSGPSQAEPNFAATVELALKAYVLPAHQQFAATVEQFQASVDRLCSHYSEAAQSTVRGDFTRLVQAFAGIEMFRFGPARENNRFERLFFWPDRKGRGLKQIQKIIATKDETATTVDRLRRKSVAVQGLFAIEYLVFGKGAEALATAGAFRCAYLVATSKAVARTGKSLLESWAARDGYAALMMAPGPENPIYRSSSESLQELLKAARVQIQVTRDLNLSKFLGKGPLASKPKRAPFWRSDTTLWHIIANIDAVDELMTLGGFVNLLPMEDAFIVSEFEFEMSQARTAIKDIALAPQPLTALLQQSAPHDRLAYALIPLGAAMDILATRYPAVLGITLGFNALDGD